MRKADKYFKDNLLTLIKNGHKDENPRPEYADGTPAHSLFTTQVVMKYNIEKGELPITLARKIAIQSGNKEIDWIYKDQTSDLSVLRDKYGIKWWDDWNIGDNTIGRRYGATVAKYDLMNRFLEGIEKDLFGRRHIINLWQVDDFKTEGLNPCAYEFMVTPYIKDGQTYIDATLIQRSSDFAVAGHINQMQYLGLAMRVAKHFGFKVGYFTHFIQNFHVYDRHLKNVGILIERLLWLEEIPKPTEKDGHIKYYIDVPDGTNFYDISWSDFKLENYEPILESEEDVKLERFELAI